MSQRNCSLHRFPFHSQAIGVAGCDLHGQHRCCVCCVTKIWGKTCPSEAFALLYLGWDLISALPDSRAVEGWSLEVAAGVSKVAVARTVAEGRGDVTLPPFKAGKAFGEQLMQKRLSTLLDVGDAAVGARTAVTTCKPSWTTTCRVPTPASTSVFRAARVVLCWPLGCGQPGWGKHLGQVAKPRFAHEDVPVPVHCGGKDLAPAACRSLDKEPSHANHISSDFHTASGSCDVVSIRDGDVCSLRELFSNCPPLDLLIEA